MRKLLALKVVLLAVLMVPGYSAGQTVSSYEQNLTSLKEKIATQIDRIKTTREYTENQMDLAKTRIEEQILRSEEQLALQLESLGLLREQLNSQSTEAELSIKRMSSDLSSFSGSALKEIDDQIGLTNIMLEKIRSLKGEICNGCSSPVTTTTTTPAQVTILAGNTPSPLPVVTPPPAVDVIVPIGATSGGG
jgi:hypothetical protein